MTAGRERLSRRRVLRDAGIAAVGGTGVAVLLDTPALAAQTAVTAINVKDSPYGAVGNGSTDDRSAIQRALDDVPSSGGVVYFPPGDYLVSGPLTPKSYTLMYGSHVPKWGKPNNPTSPCKIRAATSFSGAGLIVPTASTVSVAMRNLALVGAGVGTGVHGLRMPDTAVAAEALSWLLDSVSIVGFSGDGIFGRMHVALLTNCFIHNNNGWGINASGGNKWNDAHVANCFLFYNRLGNLYFGGSEVSAGIDFVNCRFERGGTNPNDVLAPLNPAAPGVRLASARLVEFVNCNTDANTGNGFEIVHESDTPRYRPDNIRLVNCRLARDGTGDQQTLGNFAGLKVRGASSLDEDQPSNINMVNCFVGYGLASDSGNGSVLGPRYGLWYENTRFVQWIGGNLDASPQATNNDYYTGAGGVGSNERPTIVDVRLGLLTVPTVSPGASPKPKGTLYYDATNSRLRVWDGAAWKSVAVT